MPNILGVHGRRRLHEKAIRLAKKTWVFTNPPGTLMIRRRLGRTWDEVEHLVVCVLIGWYHPLNKRIEDDVDINEFSAIILDHDGRVMLFNFDGLGTRFQVDTPFV